MALEVAVKIDSEAFKTSIDETRDRFHQAFAVSKNMIASLMLNAVRQDIAAAGNFGENYLGGVSVSVDGDTVTTTVDAPGASLFETGGTIEGHPLLWLPLSGTNAEGVAAGNYGDQLFSVNRKDGGVPLLFSIADRAPKYFGVPRVHIPKKFHIAEIQERLMGNLSEIFEGALNG